MNSDLILRNKKIRENRPLTPDSQKSSIYKSDNGTLQICFKSRGCRYYLNGYCIMCDYGKGVNISKSELEEAFAEAILNNPDTSRLLLNSYGSILDNSEISKACFNSLLEKLHKIDINNIIFETHYTTISDDKLSIIKEKLNDKNIMFELGLESSNEKIREERLLKRIDNVKFKEKIDLIHSFDMGVMINILVGIPNLSLREQLDDALNSISWCFQNGSDEVDLFPINIKPYTLLYELYKNNEYEVVSHWLLIEVLNRVPLKYLGQIYLAWYGNRELNYEENEHSIFPSSCLKCHDDIMDFYSHFMKNNDVYYRKNLITDMINNQKCSCHKKVLKKL